MKWKRVNKSHQDTFYMPKSPTDASKWAFSWMLSVVSCCAWWHLSANFLHPEFLIESFSAFCLPTSQSIKTFSFFPPSIFDSRAISYPTLNCHLFNASNCYWKWKIEKTKARWERCCCCSCKKEFFFHGGWNSTGFMCYSKMCATHVNSFELSSCSTR